MVKALSTTSFFPIIDAKRSRPSIGKPGKTYAQKERVNLIGNDQRITSGPAVKRPHSKAEYMTAPERFADSQFLSCTAGAVHTCCLRWVNHNEKLLALKERKPHAFTPRQPCRSTFLRT